MIHTTIKGVLLEFETNDQVFSPSGIDRGTQAMLGQLEFEKDDKVLDLGCGYGVVGILASKLLGSSQVVMCDISEDAVRTSKRNAELNGVGDVQILISNGLDQVEEEGFTKILSNPPYHVDFCVPKNFIEKGYRKLKVGGTMYMVTKRKDWYKNKLTSVFGGVKVIESDGYYVFKAEKREKNSIQRKDKNPQKLSKKLMRKKNRKK